MSYSDFTLPQVVKTFGLTITEGQDLFSQVPAVPVSESLANMLAENTPLALAIHTEKARSELIIMPLLVEVRRLRHREISLFSGIDFNVEPASGLNGTCDFLLSRSPEQLFLRAPCVTIVEAKNENIKGGLGRCIAEMVAAQQFNEREGTGVRTVSGAVTTGSIWKFLTLSKSMVAIDLPEYYLDAPGKILGILVHLVSE